MSIYDIKFPGNWPEIEAEIAANFRAIEEAVGELDYKALSLPLIGSLPLE